MMMIALWVLVLFVAFCIGGAAFLFYCDMKNQKNAKLNQKDQVNSSKQK